jgi:MFS transporter, ACS family, tartrate transporter
MIGAPISGFLLGLDWLQMAGWRWLFILEGLPAVIFGVVTLFYLTDWPRQAKWLAADERDWITSTIQAERQQTQKAHSYSVWEAFRHRRVIFMICGYFLIVTSGYGLAFWLPTLVRDLFGASNQVVGFISATPSCVGLLTLLVMGWSSDRTKERRWHTAIPMMVAGLGFLLIAVFQNYAGLALAMICLAAVGIYGYQPSFWSLPSTFLTGTTVAATLGFINSIGSLGGFLGPYILGYLNSATDSFFTSMVFLSACSFVAGLFILASTWRVPRPAVIIEPASRKAAGAGD